MIPLHGSYSLPRVDRRDAAHIRSVGIQIGRRTQTTPFYNTLSGAIFFARGPTPQMGPYSLPVTDPETGTMLKSRIEGIDDVVSFINLALIPQSIKDRWAAQEARREELARENATEEHLASRRKEAVSYAAHVDRKRRGVQTHVVAL